MYDEKIVKKSLDILTEINGYKLKESLIKGLMDTVYEDSSESVRNILKIKKEAKKLFGDLKPLYKNKEENKFYRLFQGLEVVPERYRENIYELAENRNAIEIYKYLVPVSLPKFYGIKSKMGDVFQFDEQLHKDHNLRVVFTDLKYDEKLGLLTDTRDHASYLL